MEEVEVDVTFIDPVEGNVGPDSEVAWCEGCEVYEEVALFRREIAAAEGLCECWD